MRWNTKEGKGHPGPESLGEEYGSPYSLHRGVKLALGAEVKMARSGA